MGFGDFEVWMIVSIIDSLKWREGIGVCIDCKIREVI